MQATMIERNGSAILVEWQDDDEGNRRAWVPDRAVTVPVPGLRAVEVEHPDQGIPYGDDLDGLIPDHQFRGQQLAKALRQHGIFTWAQVTAQPQIVQGVIHNLASDYLSAVLRTARSEQKRNQ